MRALRRVHERIEQRVAERDREIAHRRVGRRKDPPLVAIRDRQGLDLDQLRSKSDRSKRRHGDPGDGRAKTIEWHGLASSGEVVEAKLAHSAWRHFTLISTTTDEK